MLTHPMRIGGAAGLVLIMGLATMTQSIPEGTLEKTTKERVVPKRVERIALPATFPRSSIPSEISPQLKSPAEPTNSFNSRPAKIETAISIRPSNYVFAQATPIEAPEREEIENCTTGSHYIEVGNWAVVEGDIIVGTTEQPGRYAPGITLDSTSKWPNGIIPYKIDGSLPSWQVVLIDDAIKAWEQATRVVHFRKATDRDKNFITFIKNVREGEAGKICLSPVGMVKDQSQYIELGDNCGKHSIRHEIGHAIGLFHEHTRNDRKWYVKINWNNIDRSYPDAPKAFCPVMYNKYLNKTLGEDITKKYDFMSIMHYRLDAFAKQNCKLPRCSTIEPLPGILVKYGIDDPSQIGRSVEISKQDIETVKRIYGQSVPPPPSGQRWPRPGPHWPRISWCCCCCWRFRPIECCRPHVWGHEHWRPYPPRIRSSRYFDEWDD